MKLSDAGEIKAMSAARAQNEVAPSYHDAIIELTLKKPYTVDSTLMYEYPFFDFMQKVEVVGETDKEELKSKGENYLEDTGDKLSNLVKYGMNVHVPRDKSGKTYIRYEEKMMRAVAE